MHPTFDEQRCWLNETAAKLQRSLFNYILTLKDTDFGTTRRRAEYRRSADPQGPPPTQPYTARSREAIAIPQGGHERAPD